MEKAFVGASKSDFEAKTKPSLFLSTNIGNMYTSSLYGGLVSYLVTARKAKKADLVDRRLALFSYGSGLASSFFSLVIKDDGSNLDLILNSSADATPRIVTSPFDTPATSAMAPWRTALDSSPLASATEMPDSVREPATTGASVGTGVGFGVGVGVGLGVVGVGVGLGVGRSEGSGVGAGEIFAVK